VTERAMTFIPPAAETDWNDAPDLSDLKQERPNAVA
jgi:hypothetical protein